MHKYVLFWSLTLCSFVGRHAFGCDLSACKQLPMSMATWTTTVSMQTVAHVNGNLDNTHALIAIQFRGQSFCVIRRTSQYVKALGNPQHPTCLVRLAAESKKASQAAQTIKLSSSFFSRMHHRFACVCVISLSCTTTAKTSNMGL
jgi:hypothetical protein